MMTYHLWIMMTWRRGNLTCHKKFDEATAILVGDALQTLAFQILSDKKHIMTLI